MPEQQFFSLGEAAKATGKSKATISNALKTGRLSVHEKTESGYRIELGTRAQTRLQIWGELYNEFSGVKHTVELDCVQLTASKGANLVSEAGSEGEPLEFSLTLITVNGTSPGRIDGVPM